MLPSQTLLPSLMRRPPISAGEWREGKVLEIAKYCCFDVKVTRLVHEYGATNKKIFFNDRFGRKQSFAVDWTL